MNKNTPQLLIEFEFYDRFGENYIYRKKSRSEIMEALQNLEKSLAEQNLLLAKQNLLIDKMIKERQNIVR